VQVWNEDLLQDFREPGRNKLEVLLKELTKKYFLVKVESDSQQENEIDDLKAMIKNFKENKPKNIKKRKIVSKIKKEKIKVDYTIDTSETHFLVTLPFDTNELVNAFDTPQQTGNDQDDKHQYEWKIKVGSTVFSIYNWMNQHKKFHAFTDNEWHLAGKTHNKKKIEMLCKFITNKNNKTKHKIQTTPIQKDPKLQLDTASICSDDTYMDEIPMLNIDDIEF
jgi:hypothetical protein